MKINPFLEKLLDYDNAKASLYSKLQMDPLLISDVVIQKKADGEFPGPLAPPHNPFPQATAHVMRQTSPQLNVDMADNANARSSWPPRDIIESGWKPRLDWSDLSIEKVNPMWRTGVIARGAYSPKYSFRFIRATDPEQFAWIYSSLTGEAPEAWSMGSSYINEIVEDIHRQGWARFSDINGREIYAVRDPKNFRRGGILFVTLPEQDPMLDDYTRTMYSVSSLFRHPWRGRL